MAIPGNDHTQPQATRTPEIHRALRGHDFYPPAAELARVPALYANDGLGELAVVRIRYFAGWGEWYITELEPASGRAYGFAMLHGDTASAEWGYVDLPALESFQPRRIGELVERDLHFEARPAALCLPAGRRKLPFGPVRDREGRLWTPGDDEGVPVFSTPGVGEPVTIEVLHAEHGPVTPA